VAALHHREVIKTLAQFQEQFRKAAEGYSPAIIAQYALALAKSFNRMYNEVVFLKEPEMNKRRLRMAIALKTAETLAFSLALMGLKCPDKM
jgi:arginyl-tRNA synthetase